MTRFMPDADTTPKRERRLDQIREHSDKLTELARQYDKLRWMAEKDSSGAFLDLAEAAGRMTLASLEQTATLLEILWKAGQNDKRET